MPNNIGGLLLTVTAACLTVVGCGGGGDGGSAPAPAATAEGVYGGTLTGGPNPNFNMLVLENGELWSLYGVNTATNFLVAGFVQGTGTSGNGTYTVPNGKDFGFAPARDGTANANFDAVAKTIVGTVKSGASTINFSGGPIPGTLYVYGNAASLATITGSWSTTSLTGETVALTVAANGAFTARSSLGCNFNGTAAPRASGKNVFNVTLNFGPSPCALAGQTATGIALAYPLANGKTQLVVAVVDGTRSFGSAVFGTR